MLLRLDQSVQELSAISSQSCQASDCHCRKMLHRLDQICELQWQSEEKQIWLPIAGSSCSDWSNLRDTGRNYDFRRYAIQCNVWNLPSRCPLQSFLLWRMQRSGPDRWRSLWLRPWTRWPDFWAKVWPLTQYHSPFTICRGKFWIQDQVVEKYFVSDQTWMGFPTCIMKESPS